MKKGADHVANGNNESTPVLVVGGGLVGLSTAMFLARWGVSTVLVEKHPGSSAHPRALGYTSRTLELFSKIGIDLPPHDGGEQGRAHQRAPRRARVESLAGQWYEEYPWSPGGADEPEIEYSPCRATAIAQDRLEPILRDKANELGADVRLNTELIDFAQSDDGVSPPCGNATGTRSTCAHSIWWPPTARTARCARDRYRPQRTSVDVDRAPAVRGRNISSAGSCSSKSNSPTCRPS